jgi:hypothetical protein
MDGEQRTGDKPVPDDLISFMNEEQLMAYHSLERFGWYIKFIRRPLFQRPICVMSNPEGTVVGVLEDDGNLNENPDIVIRD